MGTLTVDLKAAGLTHAKGKSDNCGGEHDVDEVHVTGVTGADWVPAASWRRCSSASTRPRTRTAPPTGRTAARPCARTSASC